VVEHVAQLPIESSAPCLKRDSLLHGLSLAFVPECRAVDDVACGVASFPLGGARCRNGSGLQRRLNVTSDALLTSGTQNVIATEDYLEALSAFEGQASRKIVGDFVGLRSQALLVGIIGSRFESQRVLAHGNVERRNPQRELGFDGRRDVPVKGVLVHLLGRSTPRGVPENSARQVAPR
jgi:hypothetical protein